MFLIWENRELAIVPVACLESNHQTVQTFVYNAIAPTHYV